MLVRVGSYQHAHQIPARVRRLSPEEMERSHVLVSNKLVLIVTDPNHTIEICHIVGEQRFHAKFNLFFSSVTDH